MKVFMILVAIGSGVGREDLERIEGTSFYSINNYPSKEREVLEKVKGELGSESEGLTVWELHEFTALVNDEEFYPENFWISYVTIN